MKAQKLIVKNIGIIADATIPLDKPLIVLYGEIRQGKTTFLNAIKWVFGGAFPTDIIRKGETEACITFVLDCGSIQRSFYVSGNGTTKARPILFERDGAPVRDAVAEIKKFLNPFLLDQDFLKEKSELERKKYFASMFAIDTDGLDKDIATFEAHASATREKLKGYGDIDLTVVDAPPDLDKLTAMRTDLVGQHDKLLAGLQGELTKRRNDHQVAADEVTIVNLAAQQQKFQRVQAQEKLNSYTASVEEHEKQLILARDGRDSYLRWLGEHPVIPERPMPAAPDLSTIEHGLTLRCDTKTVDAAISNAAAAKVRFEQYKKNLSRQADRERDEQHIKSIEAAVRESRAKRIAKLKECSDNSGIPGLAFDEAGNFSYEGCQAGMLSTSQLMKLSSALSSLYPEGFGIELLDRGESLGKSIFSIIDRATAEKKTILATVVGEKPAEVPAEVGVFVVEQGVVK
jgi:recombinational DNA repair ATPase RecF